MTASPPIVTFASIGLRRELADAVAARLVLYVRRRGYQSQFSDALVAQTAKSDPLGPAIAWARAHLDRADVETFAKQAGLSVRTLHRRCFDTLATTPAKLLDKLLRCLLRLSFDQHRSLLFLREEEFLMIHF